MILEPVRRVRVRVKMLPGFGGWLAGAIIAFILAVQAGQALRLWLWG